MLRRHLVPLLLRLGKNEKSLTLLDLGCGSGHVGRDLLDVTRGSNLRLRVIGVDRQLAHARLSARGQTVIGEAFALPFESASVDVVFSTLFTHHFSPDRLDPLLREEARVARKAVVAFDLSRHRLAVALIRAIGPIAFTSRVSISDGKASVEQAYTPAEIGRLAQGALPNAIVKPRGPFAWQLTWTKP